MSRSRSAPILAVTFAAAVLAGPGVRADEAAAPTWIGPDGAPLPFTSFEQVEDFLRTAEVRSMKNLGTGKTAPKKLVLEQDGVSAHAVFKDIDRLYRGMHRQRGLVVIDLHDYHLFDCAAYQLDRLLGLGRVPPSVPRELRGRPGTVTLWLEGTIMDKDRRERHLEPPDPIRWEQQKRIMYVFHNLIGNLDSNLTNVLIDRSWKLWFIDHTRAFNTNRSLIAPQLLNRCDRGLHQALEELDEQTVRARLAPYLNDSEIDAVLVRREAILEILGDEIESMGENVALFDLRPHGGDPADW